MIRKILLLSCLGSIFISLCGANPMLEDAIQGNSTEGNPTASKTDYITPGVKTSGGLEDGRIPENSTEEVFMRDGKMVHRHVNMYKNHHNGTHGSGESGNGESVGETTGERSVGSGGGLERTGNKNSSGTGKELPMLGDSLSITTARPKGSSSHLRTTPSPESIDHHETEERNASEDVEGESQPQNERPDGSYDTYKDEYFTRDGKLIHKRIIIHHHHHNGKHHNGAHGDGNHTHHHDGMQMHHHNGTDGGPRRHHHNGRHGGRPSHYDDDFDADDDADEEASDEVNRDGYGESEEDGSSQTGDQDTNSSKKDSNPLFGPTPNPNIKSNTATGKASKSIGTVINDEELEDKNSENYKKSYSDSKKDMPMLGAPLSVTTAVPSGSPGLPTVSPGLLPTGSPGLLSVEPSTKIGTTLHVTTATPKITTRSGPSDGNVDKRGDSVDKDKAVSDQGSSDSSGNSEDKDKTKSRAGGKDLGSIVDQGHSDSNGNTEDKDKTKSRTGGKDLGSIVDQGNSKSNGNSEDMDKAKSRTGGKDLGSIVDQGNSKSNGNSKDKDKAKSRTGGKDLGSIVSSKGGEVKGDSGKSGNKAVGNAGDGLLSMEGLDELSSDDADGLPSPHTRRNNKDNDKEDDDEDIDDESDNGGSVIDHDNNGADEDSVDEEVGGNAQDRPARRSSNRESGVADGSRNNNEQGSVGTREGLVENGYKNPGGALMQTDDRRYAFGAPQSSGIQERDGQPGVPQNGGGQPGVFQNGGVPQNGGEGQNGYLRDSQLQQFQNGETQNGGNNSPTFQNGGGQQSGYLRDGQPQQFQNGEQQSGNQNGGGQFQNGQLQGETQNGGHNVDNKDNNNNNKGEQPSGYLRDGQPQQFQNREHQSVTQNGDGQRGEFFMEGDGQTRDGNSGGYQNFGSQTEGFRRYEPGLESSNACPSSCDCRCCIGNRN